MTINLEDTSPLPPGFAPDMQDLVGTALLTRMFELRVRIGALRRGLRQPGAVLADDLRACVAAALLPMRDCAARMVAGYEKTYLAATRWLEEQRASQLRHLRKLSEFRGRLVYVGTSVVPKHWSLIGWVDGEANKPAALGRDQGHVILVAGAQGSGKTVFSTVLAEGCQIAGEPLASNEELPTSYAFFHVEENDRLPQLLDGLKKNPKQGDLELLARRLGVSGQGFRRLCLAVPALVLPTLRPRLAPYEDLGLIVKTLGVRLPQFGQSGLEAALGAEPGTRYVQRMLEEAEQFGENLTIGRWRHCIDEADDLNSTLRRAAHTRLSLLEMVASPPNGPGMWDIFQPGMSTVAYLGGPHMGHGRVLPLLVALLNALMRPSPEHGQFQRVITVDEVNLFDQDESAWRAFVKFGRMVRHLGSRLILMGQDLMHVPDELFGLASLVAVFQLRNPRVYEYIRERVGALRGHRFDEVSALEVAWMLLAATETSDPKWRQGVRKIRVRPPLCEHGGVTRTMI